MMTESAFPIRKAASSAQSAGQAGNLAIPLVKQLTAQVAALDPAAARYVHWGSTSQDVIDTGMVRERDASTNQAHLQKQPIKRMGTADEVAGLVLNDNYRQNQALSLMQRMSLTRLGSKQQARACGRGAANGPELSHKGKHAAQQSQEENVQPLRGLLTISADANRQQVKLARGCVGLSAFDADDINAVCFT